MVNQAIRVQSKPFTVLVNGVSVPISPGTTVAGVVAAAGIAFSHRSVTGDERSALCGMGICFECRVTVNGRAHIRGCQTICQPDMVIVTDTYPTSSKPEVAGD